MFSLLKLTAFRGMLGVLQVMGFIFVAAGAQKWSQSVATQLPDAICTTSSAATEEPTFLAENAAAMKRMMSDKTVGDIDRDFVSMMDPHYRGATDIAWAVLRYGNNEQIRPLAQEITVTQQQEIAAMRVAIGDPLPVSVPSPTRVASSSGRP